MWQPRVAGWPGRGALRALHYLELGHRGRRVGGHGASLGRRHQALPRSVRVSGAARAGGGGAEAPAGGVAAGGVGPHLGAEDLAELRELGHGRGRGEQHVEVGHAGRDNLDQIGHAHDIGARGGRRVSCRALGQHRNTHRLAGARRETHGRPDLLVVVFGVEIEVRVQLNRLGELRRRSLFDDRDGLLRLIQLLPVHLRVESSLPPAHLRGGHNGLRVPVLLHAGRRAEHVAAHELRSHQQGRHDGKGRGRSSELLGRSRSKGWLTTGQVGFSQTKRK